MLEFPMSMERNTHCSLCFECVKSCPKNNIALRFRSFGADLWLSVRRSLDESYLALALVGLTTMVTAQMLRDWATWISALSDLLPSAVRSAVKPVAYLTLTETTLFMSVALVLAPLLGYIAACAASRIVGTSGPGARKFFVILGYMFIPVGLAMHLARNLAQLFLEGAGTIPALQRLFALYGRSNMAQLEWNPHPLLDPTVIHALQMALILIGLIFSIVIGVRLASKFFGAGCAGKALVPFIALSLLFTLINLYMLNQSMGMRHGM
jgi:ferredoxin